MFTPLSTPVPIRIGTANRLAEIGEDENEHRDQRHHGGVLVAAAHHGRDIISLHRRPGYVFVDGLERADEAAQRHILPHVAARIDLDQEASTLSDEPIAHDLGQIRGRYHGGLEIVFELAQARAEIGVDARLVACKRRRVVL
jgi:hypothetical protein